MCRQDNMSNALHALTVWSESNHSKQLSVSVSVSTVAAVKCNQWRKIESIEREPWLNILSWQHNVCACMCSAYVSAHLYLHRQYTYINCRWCVHVYAYECEFMCTHKSCRGYTLPSPDNAIKAPVLHVTFYLLSRETNKLPSYLSQ